MIGFFLFGGVMLVAIVWFRRWLPDSTSRSGPYVDPLFPRPSDYNPPNSSPDTHHDAQPHHGHHGCHDHGHHHPDPGSYDSGGHSSHGGFDSGHHSSGDSGSSGHSGH